jgi:hypothetical protein
MFPTFDVPPQHAETVGARKARKAREEETARRSSSATSQSSGSIHSAKASSKGAEKNGFGWFAKRPKVQEISSMPSIKKPSPPPPQSSQSHSEPFPPTAPLPPPPGQSLHRNTSNRSDAAVHSLRTEHFPPPPMGTLPSLPPSGALPPTPDSHRLNIPGMYCVLIFCFV